MNNKEALTPSVEFLLGVAQEESAAGRERQAAIFRGVVFDVLERKGTLARDERQFLEEKNKALIKDAETLNSLVDRISELRDQGEVETSEILSWVVDEIASSTSDQ